MTGQPSSVALERRGDRLPVLWTATAPGGLPRPSTRWTDGGTASPCLDPASFRWTIGPQRLALPSVAAAPDRKVEPVPIGLARASEGTGRGEVTGEQPRLVGVEGPSRRRSLAGRRALSLFRQFFYTISQAALAALAIVVGFTVVGSLTGTWGVVPVLTGSMRPGIQPGDLVLVTPEPLASVRTGQILDFQPPGEGGAAVVHRVVSLSAEAHGVVIRTKGDANNVADPWKAQLGGTKAWRVRAVIPKLGYVSVAEHNPRIRLGVETGLLLGGLAIALSAVWGSSSKEKRHGPVAADASVA